MLNLNGHKLSGVVTATGIAVGQNAGIRLMNTGS